MVAIAGTDIRRGASVLTSAGIRQNLSSHGPRLYAAAASAGFRAPRGLVVRPPAGTGSGAQRYRARRYRHTAMEQAHSSSASTRTVPSAGQGSRCVMCSSSVPGWVIALNDRYTKRPVARTATVSATARTIVAATAGRRRWHRLAAPPQPKVLTGGQADRGDQEGDEARGVGAHRDGLPVAAGQVLAPEAADERGAGPAQQGREGQAGRDRLHGQPASVARRAGTCTFTWGSP